MKIFEEFVKCENCVNNINGVCFLYKGKDTKEKDAGCYCGINKNTGFKQF